MTETTYTVTPVPDAEDVYAVNGPGLQQPMNITGLENAETEAARLQAGHRVPNKGGANIEATIEVA